MASRPGVEFIHPHAVALHLRDGDAAVGLPQSADVPTHAAYDESGQDCQALTARGADAGTVVRRYFPVHCGHRVPY